MKIINTATLTDNSTLSSNEVYWVYNGLDCCITQAILDELKPQLDEVSTATYQQHLRMQAPIMDMMLRGILVDNANKTKVVASFKAKLATLAAQFERLLVEGIGLPTTLNHKSPTQMKYLFYTVLQLPVQKKRNTNGIPTPSVGREELETLSEHFFAQILCNHVLAMRDLEKKLGFLKTPLDRNNRMRCNLNLAGTNTGRLSSSFSDFGTGTNLQNVDKELRFIFTPDPGKIFVNIDLEQADSRNVGALCWNLLAESHGEAYAGKYLDACESGDLHTTVCRMAWTDLPWGTAPDRVIADDIVYRNLSYRDMAKKLGHGTNYLGQPSTMAAHTKVPVKQIRSFQDNYFSGFPCIPDWQHDTIQQLQTTGQLTNLFGRRRMFFGRHSDQSVINAAIAYAPQGSTGEEINYGIHRLWLDPRFELLIQVHDSILFQIDQREVNELVPLALELLKVTIPLAKGREFFVPLEAQTGWNWGYRDKAGTQNPYGLATWQGSETRRPPSRSYQKRRTLQDMI